MNVKVKKNATTFSYFVILLTFLHLVSCKSKSYFNFETKTSKLNIDNSIETKKTIDAFILPYKVSIDKDLDSILCFNKETLDKSIGKWETNIGSFMAKTTFEMSNPIFNKRTTKNIDFVLLNHGGIRSTIPKGNITKRTAFNVMPFENSIIVVGLRGIFVKDLAKYILKENKPHPMYGIKINAYKDSRTLKNVEINNIPIDEDKIYYIATSDYLANGGDNMIFFKEGIEKIDIDYKLRNLLIDYFEKVDSISVEIEKIVIEQ